MLSLDEKQLKSLHTRANLRRFLDYVTNGQVEKITKMCSKGLDPNFHCQDSGGKHTMNDYIRFYVTKSIKFLTGVRYDRSSLYCKRIRRKRTYWHIWPMLKIPIDELFCQTV